MSPKRKPTLPIAVYVRVSQVGGRGGDSFISPDVQRERCVAQLSALGLEAGEVFVDLDQSGGKESRPEYDRMKASIESGEHGGVIVYKLSRFGRRVKNVLKDIAWIESQGAAFICVDPAIDTSTPTGRFTLTVFAALDELELDNAKVNWGIAQERAVGSGIHITGRTPPGYRRNGDRRLVPDDRNAETISEAYKMAAAGESYKKIAKYLTERQLPTWTTETGTRGLVQVIPTWRANRIRRLLANRVYVGEARYGEITNAAAHAPLVDETTFLLAQRHSDAPVLDYTTKTLLAGLCRCASCSFAMKPRSSSKARALSYRCGAAGCSHPVAIGRDRIEEYVIESFLAHVDVELEQVDTTDEARELAQAATEADRRYRDWLEDPEMQEELGDADWKARLLVLKQARDDALEAVPAPTVNLADREVDLHELVTLAQEKGETKGLRELLATQIQAVFVRPAESTSRTADIADRVHIVWAEDELPFELPKRGTRFEPRAFQW